MQSLPTWKSSKLRFLASLVTTPASNDTSRSYTLA